MEKSYFLVHNFRIKISKMWNQNGKYGLVSLVRDSSKYLFWFNVDSEERLECSFNLIMIFVKFESGEEWKRPIKWILNGSDIIRTVSCLLVISGLKFIDRNIHQLEAKVQPDKEEDILYGISNISKKNGSWILLSYIIQQISWRCLSLEKKKPRDGDFGGNKQDMQRQNDTI